MSEGGSDDEGAGAGPSGGGGDEMDEGDGPPAAKRQARGGTAAARQNAQLYGQEGQFNPKAAKAERKRRKKAGGGGGEEEEEGGAAGGWVWAGRRGCQARVAVGGGCDSVMCALCALRAEAGEGLPHPLPTPLVGRRAAGRPCAGTLLAGPGTQALPIPCLPSPAAGSGSDYDFEEDWGAVDTGNAFASIADAGTSSGEEESEEGGGSSEDME